MGVSPVDSKRTPLLQTVTGHSPGPEVRGLGSRPSSAARQETKIVFLLGAHVLP